MRILVVSNLGLIRHTIEQTIGCAKHTLHLTESVPLAIEILKDHLQIDVIICEWAIKNLTAFDLFQGYRQIDRCSDAGETLPAHFLVFRTPERSSSGRNLIERKDTKVDSLIALADAEFIDKPIDRALLARRIKEIEQDRQLKRIALTDKPVIQNTRRVDPEPLQDLQQVGGDASQIDPEKVMEWVRQIRSKLEVISADLVEVNDKVNYLEDHCNEEATSTSKTGSATSIIR